MGLIIRWILNTLALFVVAYIVPNFSYDDWISLAIAAAVLGLLNAIVRPILYVLTLPLTILTLGLFLIVLNAIMFKLTDALVPGFHIEGWFAAILGALLYSIVTMFTNEIGKKDRDEK